jgi:hypothetical protein
MMFTSATCVFNVCKKMQEFQSKIVTLIVDVLTSKEDHMLASY